MYKFEGVEKIKELRLQIQKIKEEIGQIRRNLGLSEMQLYHLLNKEKKNATSKKWYIENCEYKRNHRKTEYMKNIEKHRLKLRICNYKRKIRLLIKNCLNEEIWKEKNRAKMMY